MKTIDGKEYVSLYEYLGKAAGTILGEEVNNIAIKQNQPFIQQEVSNSVYKGKVFCYTREFLKEYFTYKQKIK